MSEMNTLLAKYWDGEASQVERQVVEKFKIENLEEFKRLELLWNERRIDLNKFNADEAWDKINPNPQNKIQESVDQKGGKFNVLVFVALALLLIGSLYLFKSNSSSENIEVKAFAEAKEIELEDGSIVFLNKGATLSYPRKFANDQRAVVLDGEAFFDVAKNPNKPFVIKTNHSSVEVLGTSFNIDSDQDQTEVAVATGKVKVASHFSEEAAVLVPNQSVLVNRNKLVNYPTTDLNYQAWRTGIYKFENTEISEVVRQLNDAFDDKIILKNSEAACLLSTSFDKLKVEEILEIITLSCNLKLTSQNNNYELH